MTKALAVTITVGIFAGLFALGLAVTAAFLALALNVVAGFGLDLGELVGLAMVVNMLHAGIVTGVKQQLRKDRVVVTNNFNDDQISGIFGQTA